MHDRKSIEHAKSEKSEIRTKHMKTQTARDGIAGVCGGDVVMELENLSIKLKTKEQEYPVVQNGGFALYEGRVLGLIGESGCGKSVTCLALMGLLEREDWSVSGSVKLKNREVDYADRERMRKLRGKEISMIMQDPISSFNPLFTVGEHFIETVCSHRDIKRKEARRIGVEMLSRINIREPDRVMSQYPFQLSGGMLQRVMIAIALFMKPSVLIADEPTTSLDVTVQYQILSELSTLRDKYDTAILLVSHDLGVVAQTADEVAVMYGGHIVEKAPVREIFHNPLHPYTHALMHAKPAFTKDRLRVLEGYPPSVMELGEGCPFFSRCALKEKECTTYDMSEFNMSESLIDRVSCVDQVDCIDHVDRTGDRNINGDSPGTARHMVKCALFRDRIGVV
jgi:oligopeptide/dipeptide ABC transporter ATP-binding protein